MGPMWMRVLCRLALALMVMTETVAAQSVPLTFTTIDVPGANRTEARGINHTGQIVKAMAKQYRSAIGPWREFLAIVDAP